MSLEAELAAAIAATADGAPAPEFESWALRVFAHQFASNVPYRRYCERRGATPATVTCWEDVPAVPTAAFRDAALSCGPPEAIFRTSGTSTRGATRGQHRIPHLALYRASALTTFARHVLPDDARVRCLFLLPDPTLRPDSSLVQMCAWVGDAYGTAVEWFAGPAGLDLARLRTRLTALEASGEAALLAGPTAAFVQLFDTAATHRLGPGSRVMDTGGHKGMTRPLSRAGFLRACWSRLAIPTYLCVNEYGMTELCSQRYDSALADRFRGRNLDARRLVAPPWLRTRVLDADTLAPLPAGETGLLCHHDLANAGSVSVVVTEDLGRTVGGDGIEVLGRIAGALPRGCGLLLADLAGG